MWFWLLPVLWAQDSGTCPDGLISNEDTWGHCCWPGQGWNGSRCVGTPTTCPSGYARTPFGCEANSCPKGQVKMLDGVHCCWPGQAFLQSSNVCVGVPTTCPAGMAVSGESCSAGPFNITLTLSGGVQGLLTCDDGTRKSFYNQVSIQLPSPQTCQIAAGKALTLISLNEPGVMDCRYENNLISCKRK